MTLEKMFAAIGANDMEQWKAIRDFPNYQISSFGRVKRIASPNKRGYMWKARILSPTIDHNGYFRVQLYGPNNSKWFYVHRLVATGFLDKPADKDFVNHLDRNITNNSVGNLEWCTLAENTAHAVKMGSFLNLPTSKPIVQLTDALKPLAHYPSIHDAARKTGLSFGNIGSACRTGRRAGGYKWAYELGRKGEAT